MTSKTMNPAAGERASGVRKALLRGEPFDRSTTADADHPPILRKRARGMKGPVLTFRLPPDHRPVTVNGRQAQTLALLIQRGPSGVTSGEASPLGWARRTAAYVGKLRQEGVPIVTTWETVGDARIGRYTLSGPVVIVWRGA